MGNIGIYRGLAQTVRAIQLRASVRLLLDFHRGAGRRAGRRPPSVSGSPFQWGPGYGFVGSVFSVLLLLATGATQAKTITALSPSLASVSTAIGAAANGDTVIVPAGTAVWTSTLVITKGITLMGQTTTDSVAGTAADKTIIQDNVTRAGASPLIKVVSVLGQTYRISGFTFQPYPGMTQINNNGEVVLGGKSHAVRLDHCHFQPTPYQMVFVGVWGPIYGVADHNVMQSTHTQVFNINMGNWPNPDGSEGNNGDGSWASPTSLGTEKFFFIEDNYIKNVTSPYKELAGNLDGTSGARWVFRHNHCYETELQNHGTEGGRYRGCRAREIYNNDFHYAHAHGSGASRSGVTISHDNTWDGVQPPRGIVLQAYRAFFKWLSLPAWGGGSGDNPWDVNDTRNGSFAENGFSYNPVNGLYASGTVSSGSKTTLVDTTKNWAPNQWKNFTAKRVSDNQIAFIMSNTSNTLTVFYYSDSGGGAIWSAGNQYQIRRPLILLDQPGRGQCDLIAGNPGKPWAWPHQALEPSYSWNDRYTPTGASVNFVTGWGNGELQRAGRDYYNNTPMPGYKPYIYPHPLVSDLAPPSNLKIVP